ncbi:co-chaperone DjlA [Litoribacillus peritrichatus]|uniref:Co-chaperone DjlA n=1 Tax=Litoribacillus peritrichatus TaxID=718191 RepID=A0ABP7LX27_9GAMM
MIKWFGLIIGGLMGNTFGVVALIIGSLLGYVFGVWLEKARDPLTKYRCYFARDNEAFRHLLHQSTFLMMGYLAKADGAVSKREIDMAEAVFDSFRLDERARKDAIRLFSEGKQPDFQLNAILDPLSSVAKKHRGLLRIFLEIQARIVIADGNLASGTGKAFLHIAKRLGFSARAANTILKQVKASLYQPTKVAKSLETQYSILGVASGCTEQELKLAYRRAMSAHHPDKLQSAGATDEMVQAATAQSQTIQEAYNTILASRNGSHK